MKSVLQWTSLKWWMTIEAPTLTTACLHAQIERLSFPPILDPSQTVSQSLLYCSHLSATHISVEETEMSYLSCGCHQHVYCLRVNENQVIWHKQLFTLIGQAWGTEILHCIAGAQSQIKWPAQLVIFSKEFSSFHRRKCKKVTRSHHQWAAYFCIKMSDLAGKCF